MKTYYYYVVAEVFGEGNESIGKVSAEFKRSKTVDSMSDIKMLEKQFSEDIADGNGVLVINFQLLREEENETK